MNRTFVALTAGFVLLSPARRPLDAQPAQRAILASKLQRDLDRIAAEAPGVMGISVVDLTSGERFGVHDTLTFPTASTIKVPILIALHAQAERGRLDLAERAVLRGADRTAGSGILQALGDGTSALSLGDLATLMIVISDNTATNMLIDRVGMETVNATIRSLGLVKTTLRRKMIRPAEMARGEENVSTPREAAMLMARIARCELPVTRARCDEIRRLLEADKPVSDDQAPGLPPGVRVAWKAGDLAGGRAGWGIVGLPGRPYVFVAMLNYGGADSASLATIGRASRVTYDYFTRLAGATSHGADRPQVFRGLEREDAMTSTSVEATHAGCRVAPGIGDDMIRAAPE